MSNTEIMIIIMFFFTDHYSTLLSLVQQYKYFTLPFIKMLLDLLNIMAAIINITTGCVFMFYFLKIKKHVQRINMNAEELLQGIITPAETSSKDVKKERLSAIIVEGKGRQYLGHQYQITDLDNMEPESIEKLYCRYEARLGGIMTKTLGNSFINMYVLGVSKFFPIADPPGLIHDLEEVPFVNHALTSTCCELYYSYGMYLAPFTAMLTTVKHVDFNKSISANKNGYNRNDRSSSSDESCQESKTCSSRDKISCIEESEA